MGQERVTPGESRGPFQGSAAPRGPRHSPGIACRRNPTMDDGGGRGSVLCK